MWKERKTMFKVGVTVVHPDYGTGVVTEIKDIAFLGNERKRYYAIDLLSQPGTTVMVAVRNEEKVGLRSPIPRSKLAQVWRILRSDPRALPSDHNERYELLKEELSQGDTLEIAQVLRDLAWRQEKRRSLTMRGKRLYRESLELLASEVTGAQDTEFDIAEALISDRLAASIANAAV
jgi:RNA polymerase-interacting CarD/CdnL/TRCF family regulator